MFELHDKVALITGALVKKVYVRIGVCYNRGAFKDSPLIF